MIVGYGVVGITCYVFLIVGVIAKISCLILPILVYMPLLFCIECYGTVLSRGEHGEVLFGNVFTKLLVIVSVAIYKTVSWVAIFSARQQILEDCDCD